MIPSAPPLIDVPVAIPVISEVLEQNNIPIAVSSLIVPEVIFVPEVISVPEVIFIPESNSIHENPNPIHENPVHEIPEITNHVEILSRIRRYIQSYYNYYTGLSISPFDLTNHVNLSKRLTFSKSLLLNTIHSQSSTILSIKLSYIMMQNHHILHEIKQYVYDNNNIKSKYNLISSHDIHRNNPDEIKDTIKQWINLVRDQIINSIFGEYVNLINIRRNQSFDGFF